MYIPVLHKVTYKNNELIERFLPATGSIIVKKGDVVRPYDELGSCFIPDHAAGYTLFAGVWGTVKEIIPGQSVLLQSQFCDIGFYASSRGFVAGEFVVFPNPDANLIPHYLENYSAESVGKVIYVGDYINRDIIKKAKALKVGALVVGSIDYEDFVYAINEHVEIAVISTFGNRRTPFNVYEYFDSISSRYVFFQGDEKKLRIPIDTPAKKSDLEYKPLALVKKGAHVQVFQKPYYGEICVVDSVTDSSIFVKVEKTETPVEIFIPNVFLLD